MEINEQTELLDVQQKEDEKPKTEEQEKSQVSLGKFKDVNALLSAYNSLQSEFTKRCQKIKELEGALDMVDKRSPTDTEVEKQIEKTADITQREKDEILKEYLQSLLGKSQGAIVLDGKGVGIKTPTERPQTITQAGVLAKEILSKK